MTRPAPFRRIFEGIRVLDFGRIVAAPWATRLLADQGAEVIKIEEPPAGDLGRTIPVLWDGQSSYFTFLNYGKESVCLDLHTKDGLAIALRLAACSDVIIENFRPGVMDRLGLGYDVISEDNPGAILCSISGFGQTSPYRNRPFQAPIGHAMSGLASVIGWANGSGPVSPGFYLGDTNAGGYAYGAICSALYDRTRTGRGMHIDLSMLDALFFLLGNPAEQHSFMGGKIQTEENRARTATVPSVLLEAVDSIIYIGGGIDNTSWRRLCGVIGRPELAHDPRFAEHPGRVARRTEVETMLQEWLLTLDSADDAERVLSEAGVIAAKVRTIDDAVTDEHFAVRGMVLRGASPDEPWRTGNPFRYSTASSEPSGPAPALGEHNVSVLTRVLGMDSAAVVDLRRKGVLWAGTPAE